MEEKITIHIKKRHLNFIKRIAQAHNIEIEKVIEQHFVFAVEGSILCGFGKIKGKLCIPKPKKEVKKQQLEKEGVPQKLRWEVFERDNFTCKHCGSRRFLEADHIIPESKGGKTSIENLQTLCQKCNNKKGVKVL